MSERLKAGRDLDNAVAEQVMGFTLKHGTSHYDGRELPWTVYVDRQGKSHNPIAYSTDPAASWQLADKLQQDGWLIVIEIRPQSVIYTCRRGADHVRVIADTLPEALALCALAAVEQLERHGGQR